MYGTTIAATSWETNGYNSPANKNTSGHYDHQKSVFEGESGRSFWTSIMDQLNDDVAQKELSDWLETTDVFEEGKECSPLPPEAAAQGQKRHELKRESSFEHVRSDGEMFGIDAQTALRAAQMGMASSDNVTATHDLWAPLSSSSSSEKPKPQSSSTQGSHQQQVIDLTITEPAIDLTAEDALYQPPSRNPASASLNVRNQDRNDSQVNFHKRPRMSFVDNIEESKNRSSSLDDQALFSSVATMGAQQQPHQERRQSSPTSRRSSPESINSWQKISIKDPQQANLSETMPAKTDQHSSSSTSFFRGVNEDSSRRPNFINNWQKQSLQDPQQSSLPESKPAVTGQDSTSTSFFGGGSGTNEDSSRRNSLDFINYVQQHSQNTNPRRKSISKSMPPATGQSSTSTTFSFHDFINQVQQQSQHNPRRTSLSASMPPATATQDPSSSTSFFRNMDEQSSHVYRMMDAMAQTRQSRQMVSSFLDNGTNSFNNMNVAASANSTNSFNMNVATSAATANTAAAEGGMQYGAAGIVEPLPNQQPPPMPANDTRAAANNVEMTPEWVEAKRNLDQIAREQKELDEKIAELLKRGGRP